MSTNTVGTKPVFIFILIICGGMLLGSIQRPLVTDLSQKQPPILPYAERKAIYFNDQASGVLSSSSFNATGLSSTEKGEEEIKKDDAEPHPKKFSSVSKETKSIKDEENAKLSHKGANITEPDHLEIPPFSTCSSARFGAAGSLPKKALWSYPGSGNTWVRYLIERATGLYTGSIWCDMALQNGGLLGECKREDCGCVVVVKVHRFEEVVARRNWKGAIFIIRNPYDAMKAEWNRQTAKGHKGIAEESHFKGQAWSEFVMQEVESWRKAFDGAVDFFKSLLIVHYEDLISDLTPQLYRIVEFLGINNTDTKARIDCTAAHSTGNFKRGKKEMSFDPYTQKLRLKVDAEINHVINKMRTKGIHLPPFATEYVSSNSSTV